MKDEKKELLETNDDKTRVGFVGSRKYDNVAKIRRGLLYLKEKFGDDLIIVSGGANSGADKITKRLLSRDGQLREINYEEFPPKHRNYNENCILPEEQYGKEYNVGHYFERNEEIAERVDYLFAFIPQKLEKNNESSGTQDTVEKTRKRDKKVKIIN